MRWHRLNYTAEILFTPSGSPRQFSFARKALRCTRSEPEGDGAPVLPYGGRVHVAEERDGKIIL